MSFEPNNPTPDTDHRLSESLAYVREALVALKFGNVALTVHEGKVVQIDVTEKKRMTSN